jgi:hypothetical protein
MTGANPSRPSLSRLGRGRGLVEATRRIEVAWSEGGAEPVDRDRSSVPRDVPLLRHALLVAPTALQAAAAILIVATLAFRKAARTFALDTDERLAAWLEAMPSLVTACIAQVRHAGIGSGLAPGWSEGSAEKPSEEPGHNPAPAPRLAHEVSQQCIKVPTVHGLLLRY